jgi:PAS domain S-box-containing protein
MDNRATSVTPAPDRESTYGNKDVLRGLDRELRDFVENASIDERILSQSERRFREMLDALPAAIYTTDAEGRLTHFNPAAVEFSGRVPQLGSDQWCVSLKLYHLDGTPMPHDKCPMAIALKEGRTVRGVQAIAERPDGTRVWFEPYPTPLRDAEGRIVGGINMLLDITERKQAEETSARLAAIVESSEDAIISKDLDGVITSWNRGAERIFGYTASEVIGHPVTMLFPPNHHDEEPGILQRIRRGESVEHYETVRRRKDGKLLDISLSVSPVTNATGKVIGASKIARDITERKQTEKRIAADLQAITLLHDLGAQCARSLELTQCLDKIIETAIVITQADKGNIQLFDGKSGILEIAAQRGFEEPFLKFFAAVRSEEASVCAPAVRSAQRVIVEDVTQSDIFAGQPSLRVLLDAGVRAVQSTPIITGTGDLLGTISTHFSKPHHLEERELRLMDLLALQTADYLERKRAEQERNQLLAREQAARAEAEAANRLKDEFLATISHELRTPLNAMLGWAEMLRRGGLDDKSVTHGLETIARNARAQNQLISDLLDVSRIISGQLRVESGTVDLVPIIEAALDTVRPAANAKGVELRLMLDPAAGMVAGDSTRLQQIVWNLLTNAVKFTSRDGRISVQLKRDNGTAAIIVTDTGEGISPEFLPYIFDRFRQAESTTKRQHGGLGLGLSIVRHLVEAHGGSVRAESRGVGRGATFTVTLPLIAVPGNERSADCVGAGERSAVLGAPPVLKGLRVLVIDDEADTRELLTVALTQSGAEVRASSTVLGALAIVGQWKPDVLVSDIGMPGEDGYDLIREVRAREQENGGRILALALTGYVSNEDVGRDLAAGYQTHIPKPVSPSDLVATIATVATQLRRS